MGESLVTGDEGLPAAVFIYKADGSTTAAWQSVKQIADREGAIRGELHASKAPFVKALGAWNQSVDPVNAFLCIYSHAGVKGIAPVSKPNRGDIIEWHELADALSHGVRYLWLLGCGTDHAHAAWADRLVPVAHHSLSTLESANWQPFIEFFAQEISVDEIVSADELMSPLRAVAPTLADHTIYRTNEKWSPQ